MSAVRRRIVPICYHFRGYTADALWSMRFSDWVLIADAADQLVEELAKNRPKGGR